MTVFGVDGLSRCEVKGEGRACGVGWNVDALGDEGFEVHFDAGLGGVPDGLVAKGGGVEVCAEVAIEASEDVEVEGGGGAGGVVVGGEDGGFVFTTARSEVGAEEELVAGEELSSEVAENVARVFG